MWEERGSVSGREAGRHTREHTQPQTSRGRGGGDRISGVGGAKEDVAQLGGAPTVP